MKFTKEQKEKIKQLRKEYSEIAKEQDKKFAQLCKELGYQDNHNDWLFDYIYNGFGSIKLVENNGQVKVK